MIGPHFHKPGSPEGQVNEADLIPNGTVLQALPMTAPEGAYATLESGGGFAFYRFIQGAWRALGGSSGSAAVISTNFEDISSRFQDATYGGGSLGSAASDGGLSLVTSGAAGGGKEVSWRITNNASIGLELRGAVLNIIAEAKAIFEASGAGHFFAGLGQPIVSGTAGITFTDEHIGFKAVKTGGIVTLYGTQADGTTEQATILGTITGGDVLDLRVSISSGSASYSYSVNGGAWSAAITITGNMPTGMHKVSFATSNVNTGAGFDWVIAHASVTRF